MSVGNEQRAQFAESANRIGEDIATLKEKARRDEDDYKSLIKDRIEPLEKRVATMDRMVAWVFGAGTALGTTGTLLALGVKAWLQK